MNRIALFLTILLALPMAIDAADEKPGPVPLEPFIVHGTKVKAADADAPLAEGWPKGTEPGMIEIKKYPPYRSAIARGKGASMGADNVLFYPLFNHISRSDIAMTTPVVSTYSPEMVKEPRARGDASMEFVYRSPTLGQAGQGVGSVQVEDHAACTFVCLGVQGDMDPSKLKLAVEAVKAWLVEHKSEWVEDGPVRRLGYHGPMTRRDERLWEVQIPVKSVPKPTAENHP